MITGNALIAADMSRFFEDAITGETYASSDDVKLQPYQTLWLVRV